MMQASSSQESAGTYTRTLVEDEMLRTLSNDPTAEVRLAALAALLAQQRQRGLSPRVIKVLCQVVRNDPDPKVQIAAIDALNLLMVKIPRRPRPLRYVADRERVRSMPVRIMRVWRRTREMILGLPPVLTALTFIVLWLTGVLRNLWTLFFH